MNQHPVRSDPYAVITDLILQHLERGVVPWRQPWQSQVGAPRKFHSDQCYQGVNVLLLGLQRFASPYWLTFRQVQLRGGLVRKGEHGAMVVRYGQYAENKANEADDHDEKKRQRSFLKAYTVFNAVQIEGIAFPDLPVRPPREEQQRIAQAEALVAAMPSLPRIEEGRRAQACYHPVSDHIDLPSREDFESLPAFYLTLYHELVHASGHPKRLNRPSLIQAGRFGTETYSQEELVAEMGAAFLGMEVDLIHDQHENSAAYLQGWLKVLKEKDHRRWIVQAASQATRAANFILNRPPVELSDASA